MPETVAELAEWTIAVESWDAGEPQLITEDRGLGYETREVRPTTAVTRLDAGTGPLRPWKDLPEVGPEVSGVGEYSAVAASRCMRRRRRPLCCSTSAPPPAGSDRCRVNDGAAEGFDTSHPVVDVTDDVRAGDNTSRSASPAR